MTKSLLEKLDALSNGNWRNSQHLDPEDVAFTEALIAVAKAAQEVQAICDRELAEPIGPNGDTATLVTVSGTLDKPLAALDAALPGGE